MLSDADRPRSELYTPPDLAGRALEILGEIDLDPASDDTGRTHVSSRSRFTAADDGLAHPWHGRIWLFPPAGKRSVWVAKLLHEYRVGRIEAALLYDGIDPRAPWFQHVAREASVCFTGPLRALNDCGEPIARTRVGSMLCYLGPDTRRFAAATSDLGAVLVPWRP
jgi:hypothetical protein